MTLGNSESTLSHTVYPFDDERVLEERVPLDGQKLPTMVAVELTFIVRINAGGII